MDISLIVAVGENGIIGNDNKLPWKLSSDLKRFRKLTMGKPIIMGRKTFDSIGKPLEGRDNIIVTRDESFQAPGAFVVHSIEQSVLIGKERAALAGAEEVMMIGGAELYGLFLPFATRIYYTLVHATPEGDASFPALDPGQWDEIERFRYAATAKDSADFSYILYEKSAA